jgi:hypothetical protein
MIAGASAISSRKGSRWHGTAANVFVVSMLPRKYLWLREMRDFQFLSSGGAI